MNDKVYRTSSKKLNDNAKECLKSNSLIKKQINVKIVLNPTENIKVLFPDFS